MKNLSDDSSGFADSSDLVFATPPAQNASTVVGGTPAPVLGAPIAVPQEELQAEAAFAASGSGGPGSVVTVTGATSAGLTINLLFDAAAMAAPQSFRDGITQAMQMICGVVTDNITLNLQIDYSGTGGGASGGPSGGNYVSYSTVHSDLVNNASPGDTTFNSLPSGSTIAGQSQVAVWYSQEKLWGLLSPTGTEVDGSATFATDISPSLLIGVALHELTHAMGRVPYGGATGQPDIFDFYRFTSAGNYLINGNSTAPAAYFSLDGGNTKIADYGTTSDPSDFLNSGLPGPTDPFDEFYSSSTQQHLTAIDLQQLDALGFHLATSTVIEAFGSTELVLLQNNYFLDPVAGGTGPTLKVSGTAVTPGQFSLSLIGAEQVAGGGYDVAWKASGSDLYAVWSVDSNGNFVSNLTPGGVSGSSAKLESFETTFHQDLNGDGVIGPPSATSTIIEESGSTALVQSGSDYFLNPVAGGTGPTLKVGGTAVTPGQFSLTPIGVEHVAGGGYDVAWKAPGSDLYAVWSVDSNGNFVSNLTPGGVSGSSTTLESFETTFLQDLNGDHVVGVPGGSSTVIEESGSTALVLSGNNYFLNPVSGPAGPTLKVGGTPVTPTTFTLTPIGAEHVAGGGYDVVFKASGSDLYAVWSVDSNGNYLSNLTPGGVSGSSATLESYETILLQDLNGDHVIGVPPPTAPATSTVAATSTAATVTLTGLEEPAGFNFRPNLGPSSQETPFVQIGVGQNNASTEHIESKPLVGVFQPLLDSHLLDHTASSDPGNAVAAFIDHFGHFIIS